MSDLVERDVRIAAMQNPELLSGGPHAGASDLYSLGAMLYVLDCGAVPVLAHSLDELSTADAASPAFHLNEIRPRLPVRFVSAVAATSPSVPPKRPASANALAQALGGTRCCLIRVKPTQFI